jgi:excinuclease UvrABC nuclease subunit
VIQTHSTWKTYLLHERMKIPLDSGVYAIYKDDDVVYVGQTTNLRHRLSGHSWRFRAADGVGFSSGMYIKCKPCLGYLELERKLIGRLRPSWNKMAGLTKPRRETWWKRKGLHIAGRIGT